MDLDLYLTGPSWETVYFANNPSRSGGKLERDVRCADRRAAAAAEPALEWATFADPAPGRYRVGVDYLEGCEGGAQPVGFRVVIEYGGARHEHTGVVQLRQFLPVVSEFELRRAAPTGPLTLVMPPPATPLPENKP
ncbi:MAG: hypothetical protein HY699_15600 [Deltaproteobacteria bacterium]|nr:hypothetical protein [Deltaproteobacteria bacterium]